MQTTTRIENGFQRVIEKRKRRSIDCRSSSPLRNEVSFFESNDVGLGLEKDFETDPIADILIDAETLKLITATSISTIQIKTHANNNHPN